MSKTHFRSLNIGLAFALALALGLALVMTSGSILGSNGTTYTENFDTADNWYSPDNSSMSSYGAKAYTDTARPDVVSYYAEVALRQGSADQDGFPGARSGDYSWRLRNADGSFWQATITEGGVGDFSVWVRRWDGDPGPNYVVEYSLDNGTTWTELSTINNTWLDVSSDWKEFTGTIDAANGDGEDDNIIIQIRRVDGERIMIDDFSVTTYSGKPTVIETDPQVDATNVPVDATIAITFSEVVTVTENWFDISCDSGEITGTTAPAGPVDAYVITPADDFGYDEECVVTVLAAEVTNGAEANMADDYVFTFTTESLFGDVTFMYHDLEGVVQTGETVYIAGDFNGWSTSATPLDADAAVAVFSTTISDIAAGEYSYKYIVYTDTTPSGPPQWDWLNTHNRVYTVTGDAMVHDYRNVEVGWANLDGPAAATTDMGAATDVISGQLYINNVTNPAGEGRGLLAEVGYGDSADPADWDWFPMTFAEEAGNNDRFTGMVTPPLPGVYSYTVRFDGNGGAGNPNAEWVYGDLTGVVPGEEFSLADTGVLTVNFVADTVAEARAGEDDDIFALEGKVTVENGTWGYPEWVLQDETGGIAAYFNTEPFAELGDTVRVVAPRGTFNGQVQMVTPVSYFEIVEKGDPVEPDFYTTAEVAAGDTEGWLIEMEGVVSGYDGTCTRSHNFSLDDGSGAADIRIDYRAGINFCEMGIQNGDTIGVIGFSTQFRGTPQVKPRSTADIILGTPLIRKAAPDIVDAGALLTYTLTVENQTGYDLSNVVITDVAPANATFAYALDGGSEGAGVVSWNFAALTQGDTLTARFVMTATEDVGAVIVNDNYAVAATNYVTATFGSAVSTFVGDYLPIHEIQGEGFVSPYQGVVVPTEGVVVGFFEGNSSGFGNFDAFFIQDPDGGGEGMASDGIMIHPGMTNVGVNVGDLVRVIGEVQEYSEWDGPNCANFSTECVTQIAVSDAADVEILSNDHEIDPVVVNPPLTGVMTNTLYWESLEGMLVTLPVTGVVVGPTNYNTIDVVRSDYGIERVLRNTPYEGAQFGVRHFARYGNMPGGAPNLIVGSTITNVTGPLAYSYGRYIATTQGDDMWEVIEEIDAPQEDPSWPAAADGEFTVASFNMYNFSSASGTRMDKVVHSIDTLGGPSILSLQEIDVSAVITDLLDNLAAEGYPYDYAYSHPDVGGHGVAVLWRTDHLDDVTWSTDFQGCSPDGSSSSTYDPIWDECQAQGEYPLFSRRPVVVTGTVQSSTSSMQVVVIGNHFKSKLGGIPADYRRLGQAELVAGLADHFAAHTTPYVIVLGDLNDFEDSPPLDALYADDVLTNTWFTLAPEERYSYNYNGVSQILDHILVSPALLDAMFDMSPLHVSSDYPYHPYSGDESAIFSVSDHDLLAATFASGFPALTVTKSVDPTTDVEVGDIVTYTITLSNAGSGVARGVVMTDVLPMYVEPGGWVYQGSATILLTQTLTWGPWDVAADTEVTYIFTATAIAQSDQPVVNTVEFTSENAGAGDDEAAFEMAELVPVLTLNKTVVPAADVNISDTVTYTITIENSGEGMAEGVMLTDTLPTEIEFGGWLPMTNLEAVEQDGVITWTGDLPAGVQPGVIVFTATVVAESEDPVVNTVIATADNAEAASANAEFSFPGKSHIFLPLVMKH